MLLCQRWIGESGGRGPTLLYCPNNNLHRVPSVPQTEPLDQVVTRLCGEWGVPDPGNFALKSEESKVLSKGSYITDLVRLCVWLPWYHAAEEPSPASICF